MAPAPAQLFQNLAFIMSFMHLLWCTALGTVFAQLFSLQIQGFHVFAPLSTLSVDQALPQFPAASSCAQEAKAHFYHTIGSGLAIFCYQDCFFLFLVDFVCWFVLVVYLGGGFGLVFLYVFIIVVVFGLVWSWFFVFCQYASSILDFPKVWFCKILRTFHSHWLL